MMKMLRGRRGVLLRKLVPSVSQSVKTFRSVWKKNSARVLLPGRLCRTCGVSTTTKKKTMAPASSVPLRHCSHVGNHRTKLIRFTPRRSFPKVYRPTGGVGMGRRRRPTSLLVAFLGGLALGFLLFLYRDDPSMPRSCSSSRPALPLVDETVSSGDATSRGLLFIGVMTAKRYLNTRAKAVYETWGKDVPGKIEFFSSEDSTTNFLPLVALPGVDDSYPPQKKSFMMLYHMWERHGDAFEWFLRADDDIYIRTDRLNNFLRSIDSRKPWFIGQAGRGQPDEYGLLSLDTDDNFCMGGPGVIMSRETLSRVAPHIRYCLKNLYTTHEDVELGRCVKKFAGVPCTWSYEMQTILYHNSSGQSAFTGNLKQKEIHRAITLHPVKKHENMYRIDNYMKMLHIRDLNQEKTSLFRDILSMSHLLHHFRPAELTDGEFRDSQLFGQPPGLLKYRFKNSEELIHWDFIQRSLYSSTNTNPRRKIDAPLREGLDDVIREVMDMINMYSKQRGRVIDFKEIQYGYHRYNPIFGADYILDMLLVYKKYRGRKMTVLVRRHAYLQQQFSGLDFSEISEGQSSDQWGSKETQTEESIINGIHKIGQSLPALLFPSARSDRPADKIVNFVVPLAGRFDTFRRFIRNFESVCLQNKESVTLTVVLFRHPRDNSYQRILDTMKGLQKQYTYTTVTVVPGGERFSRGAALALGASTVQQPNDLLFFIDVDMTFDESVLRRIRLNTVRGRSVYYPIVFSEFSPEFVYGKNVSPNHFKINQDTGYWRQYGFGIVSLYKTDLLAVGGFNTSIVGWGKEDVDLYDKFVLGHSPPHNLTIFRAVDPGLVHAYHSVDCDPSLVEAQLRMCLATRADTYAGVGLLSRFLKSQWPRVIQLLSARN